MKLFNQRQWRFIITLVAATALNACTKKPDGVAPDATTGNVTEPNSNTTVALINATPAECPNGGVVLKTFHDLNANGLVDSGEVVVGSTSVCSGANGVAGANGTNGINGAGAGIEVLPAAVSSCPTGGISLTTFTDKNSNALRDLGEPVTSKSTVCNGTNASLTSSAASAAQCPAGGLVYASLNGDGTTHTAIVCNGVAGQDATFQISAVGSAVPGQTFTACHHDALYLPDQSVHSHGWLIFRHQSNGASDQGIGSTGFNVWNVDISDFTLASEVAGVNYCTLHWDPTLKRLTYTVIENTYGLAGQSATIQF